MVEAARAGHPVRAVARKFGVSRSTVERWLARAGQQRLDRVVWSDRPSTPHTTHRTKSAIEDQVLVVRRELQVASALGEYGAIAIHRHLKAVGRAPVPAVRTIGRILERRGALDVRRRIRRPPPPRGWYLPPVAAGQAEVDSFDVIEDLVIEGGIHVDVLTALSLHDGLAGAWPVGAMTTDLVLDALVAHWRVLGLPTYAQFDNDTRFQGAHQFADAIGRVTRLCLSLAVTPVFTPVQEHGFQAGVESFNGRWQQKVWQRLHHESLPGLAAVSARYIEAHRRQAARRADAAPCRRAFPAAWRFDRDRPVHGQIVFLRRTNDSGTAGLLGHAFPVDRRWQHRLVRCEVDLDVHRIRFYALRRRDPGTQPLLRDVVYRWPGHH
jgi:hypothetical protein